jgi:hypothetical protein
VTVPVEIAIEGDYVIRVNSSRFNPNVGLHSETGKLVHSFTHDCSPSNTFVAHLARGTYDLLVSDSSNYGGEFSVDVHAAASGDYQYFDCTDEVDDGMGWWGSDYSGYGEYGTDYPV